MNRHHSFNPILLLLFLVTILFGPQLTCDINAQTNNSPKTESKITSSDNDQNSSSANQQNLTDPKSPTNLSQPYLQIPSGERILINDTSKLDEIFELLGDHSENKIPPYAFTSIDIEGKVVNEYLDLNISMSLTINKSDSPIKIPFYLNQAFLTKPPSYEGAGKLLQAGFFEKENNGYSWWLQGKGKHLLKFPMRLKITKQLNNNRLQLKLPPSAITQLTLNVPDNSIQVENIKNGHIEQITSKSKTILKASINGTELDLSWHPVPKNIQEENVIQARSKLNLQITDDSYLLEANQTIEISNGSFHEVGIQLPDHFELVDIRSPFYQSHQIDSQRHVKLTFSKPITDKVNIHWNLEATRSTDADSINEYQESVVIINGFQLDRAKKQTGTIEIDAPRGFHLSKIDGSHNVHRIDPSAINFSNNALTAYSFERQPFSLSFSTTVSPPHYSVEPFLSLKFSEKEVELSGLYRFEVSPNQSALKTLHFDWPDFAKEGWIIEPINVPGVIETVHPSSIIPDLRENNSFDITVRKNESNRIQVIQIPIHARIKLTKGQKKFNLGLPIAKAPTQNKPILIIEEDANMIANFKGSENTTLIPLMNPNHNNFPIMFKKKDHAKLFQINSDELKYEITLSKQPLKINTNASIIANQEKNSFSINQTMNFNVANEKIDHIDLIVSTNDIENNSVQFLLDSKPIKPIFTKAAEGNNQNIHLKLPKNIIGNFSLQILHRIPEKSFQNSHLNIPIFHPQDSFLSNINFEFQGMKQINPSLSDTRWTKVPNLDSKRSWVTEEAPESIPLTLSNSSTSFNYRIPKVLISNEIQPGKCTSHANYSLNGLVDDITIFIPKELTVKSIFWNQIKLSDKEHYSSVKNEYGNFRIIPPQSNGNVSTSNLLVINYSQSINPNNFLSSSIALQSPIFPENIWIAKTIQEINLPFKQHLLTHPEGYDPLFRWTRNNIIWKREQIQLFQNLNSWIPQLANSEIGPGNKYAFYCNGAPQNIKFKSMANSVIVLFGAGFALLTSFLLIKFPAIQSVISIFIFTLFLAFLRLWFEDSITLFVQPALLGLGLAFLATYIEKRFKKEPSKNIVTLSSPSDLYIQGMPQSSIENQPSIGAGSEDPTSVRQYSANPLSQSDPGNQL